MTTLKIQPLAVDQTGDFYFNTVTANNLLVNTVNVYDSIVGANANIALLFSVNNYQNTIITNVNTYATSAYGQANIATTLAQAAFNYANTIVSDTQIDPFARANANAALATANTASANTIYLQGVNTTQNTNITTADVKAQAAFDKANTGVTTSFDQYARDTANSAQANTIYNQGVDTTQNTNISLLQGAMTSANANIVQIFGITLGQNAFSQAAFNTANTASANTIYLQGVVSGQNTFIQAAFDRANTGISDSIDAIARANANAAYGQANIATSLAQSAFDYANTIQGGGGSGTFTGGLVTGPTIFASTLQANGAVRIANTSGNVVYTLPNYDGVTGQSLITDGYGRLQWTTLTAINGTGGGTSTGFPYVDLGFVWENPSVLLDMGTLT